MNNVSKHLKNILAYIWLGTAILSIGIAIKEAIGGDMKNTAIFSLFALVSFYFFRSRRKAINEVKSES
jgi:hypothetical protein